MDLGLPQEVACRRHNTQVGSSPVPGRPGERHQVPLIYFHGIVPGSMHRNGLCSSSGTIRAAEPFTVSVDERRFAHLGAVTPDNESPEIRRRYVTRLFRQRLHQTELRERVVRAYQHHCAVCRLKRDELLEAAHIVPDADPLGAPSVRNGVALCRLHHAAFDRCLIGINPDCIVEVRRDVLEDSDG